MRGDRLMALPFPALQHFGIIEFDHPELVNNDCALWLDAVRHKAGVPFILTSDARTPERNREVGGSPASLHLLGRAFDFTLRVSDPVTLFKVMEACFVMPASFGKEIEYVLGDIHIHIGLFPDQRPSRLILKDKD